MSLNLTLALILLGGWLFSRFFSIIRLPHILGMVIFGILLGSLGASLIPETIWIVEPGLKSIALIVILLRAGLGLSKTSLQKSGKTALLMTFVPCLFEGGALIFLFHYFFNFEWYVAGLTAFMLAAVSPAVIVPSMLDLQDRGYDKGNEVPSLVLAGASADDVIAITLFSIFLGFVTSGSVNIGRALLNIPVSLILGIVPGIIIGLFLVRYFKAHHQKVRATEKTLILLSCAVLLFQLGERLNSAALLGIMTVGFILFEKAGTVAHELALKLKKIWIFAEIVLFVLIGMSVDVNVALQAGGKGLLVIIGGLIFRSFGVLTATAGSRLNMKERLFCVIAYLPKATVQAALGSVALQNGVAEGEIILAIAVLSILFTAPLGLLGIRVFGPGLLSSEINIKNRQ